MTGSNSLKLEQIMIMYHFLIQSTPNYSAAKVITTVKRITAKRIFAECPEVKKQLWGGTFWSDG